MKILKKSDGRVSLLDEVRGFAIICMVVYHAAYNLVFLFGVDIPVFTSSGMNALRDLFAGIFIFISGAVCHYSRNNLKRGGVCFLCGMLLTAVTYFVMPSQLIVFGILHMLGVGMMLYPLTEKLLKKLPTAAGYALFFLLFLVAYRLPGGSLGVGALTVKLPGTLYDSNLFFLGFPSSSFYSSDYFPLFPWIFIFFAGFYLGRSLKENRLPAFFYNPHCRPLAAVGRNTLIIYLLHQPVIYGIMQLISFFCTTR